MIPGSRSSACEIEAPRRSTTGRNASRGNDEIARAAQRDGVSTGELRGYSHHVELTWHDCEFDALTARQLYKILALRASVFVVEQRCIYQDPDGHDLAAHHVWAEHDGRIVACLRILPAGAKYDEISIGRVVVDPSQRGKGLGHDLVRRGVDIANGPVRISAQAHLEELYCELGFVRASDLYDEDGIPHLEMVRT
jgi:ElaA protein